MNLNIYLKLLPQAFRKRGVWMVIIGLLRRFLDLIGLASLLPIIIVIMNPSSIEGNSFIARLFQFIGMDNLTRFGFVLGMFALVMLPVKSVVTIWLGNIQYRYYLEIYRYYSQKMYNYYHSKGLLFIRQTYSSHLAFHINGACYGFATGIIATLVDAASNLVITTILVCVLIWLSPMASLVLMVAMVPVFLIYFTVVRNKLKKIGLEAYQARQQQVQIVQESIKGHVSINVNDSFEGISKEFGKGLEAISQADLKNNIFGQIPAVILQMCVALALTILFIDGTTGNTSISLFIVFGFLAIRIMPSILALANSWNSLQNQTYVADIIKEAQDTEDSKQTADNEVEAISFDRQINLTDITFGFEVDTPVFSDFSLEIRKGQSIGFRGGSGAGKSTLFNLLLGFYIPQQGGVYIDGTKLSAQNRKNWHKIVGYVEQDVFIRNDSLARNIAMSTTEPDNDKIIKTLEKVGLKRWYDDLKDGLNTTLGEGGANVSGGEKQRIGIARALYKDPQVLFVDEATSALDTKKEEEIVSLLHSLASRDFTLLIISHRENALKYCDCIVDV